MVGFIADNYDRLAAELRDGQTPDHFVNEILGGLDTDLAAAARGFIETLPAPTIPMIHQVYKFCDSRDMPLDLQFMVVEEPAEQVSEWSERNRVRLTVEFDSVGARFWVWHPEPDPSPVHSWYEPGPDQPSAPG
ncbi:MAG: hypothetical protein EDR02_15590 [Actinobacteria bacterium]|nr:MAG: hypothetical protein EDR02_15590 [Actinomycetota bacterium]RIK03189.1 MAG: hypothetical protein DCC48_16890 [Acidobacteriota bacterium]